ncbi:hypothetical protein, partial [Oleiagrimonas sp.]|uniref:hypothetical protein n=1 Tax=Oleiagrimonas sp. TaxID=2010330 RepID=UPI002632BFC9
STQRAGGGQIQGDGKQAGDCDEHDAQVSHRRTSQVNASFDLPQPVAFWPWDLQNFDICLNIYT